MLGVVLGVGGLATHITEQERKIVTYGKELTMNCILTFSVTIAKVLLNEKR
jgi:hypothetical protein